MPPLQQIHVLRSQYLAGPNAWAYKPILENIIDICDFEDGPTNVLPGFNERLLEILPGLLSHDCTGGFPKRLQEGTWIGHVLEHVVLELQDLFCAPQSLWGRTRQIDANGLYYMVFTTENEKIGREILNIAIKLVLSIVHKLPFDLKDTMNNLTPWLSRYEIGPGTSKIIAAAKERKIPVIRPTRFNWFQLGYGCDAVQIWTSCSQQTSLVAETIASDKQLVKELLKRAFVHTPEGGIVSSYEEALSYLNSLKCLTIKPLDSNRGHGVILNLMDAQNIKNAFHVAKKYSDKIIVEKCYSGITYKFIIIKNKIEAVIQGIMCNVIGDGKHSIDELIDQLNKQREKGYGDWQPLVVIERDDDLDIILNNQGASLESILAKNQEITLSLNFQGLQNIDPNLFHPDILRDVFTAHRVVGLDISGIDTIIQDISKPFGMNNGAILEVNAGPSIFAYENPIIGESKPIGDHIVEYLTPLNARPNFFLISIAGTKSFDHLIENLSKHFMACGEKIGIASKNGTYLQGKNIDFGRKVSLHESAKNLFMNKFLDAAIVEVDFPTLMNYGAPYASDTPQVTVLLSIDPSCLLNLPFNNTFLTLEKIFRTPLDLVPDSGIAILNGDDPVVVELAKYAKKVCFATTKSSIDHLNIFPDAQIFWYQNSEIKVIENGRETVLMKKYISDSDSALVELAFLATTRFYANYRKK